MAQRTHTVFVSSTSEDLTDFRDALHDHLTRTGIFICTHQKTMGGRHAETVASCREHAASADFYIGLIGMRRGWEPDGDSEHRSITEIEYDSAKADSRFVYVTNERFPVPGNLRETDEEHRRQLEFRQRVKTRIVALPDFGSPERLAAQIVQELLVHVQKRPTEPDPLANLPDAVAERILRLLDQRGDIKKAERGGLERDIVLKLAKRITPDDTLDFDRAVTELENAVNIALDAIARGRRGSNEDDFVNDVLKTVATHTQAGETERAVKALDDALKELDSREAEQRATLKRSRLTLLEAGIEQDILRRCERRAARRSGYCNRTS
jgi:flagellar biosynthesis chaperone FliJ